MPTFRTATLRDLRATLVPVLDELVASDLERRPFVVVEDAVTKRFVQFARRYRPRTGELLFDVPALGVRLRPCPDTRTGAMWATAALIDQGLPDSAELVVRIDGDEVN